MLSADGIDPSVRNALLAGGTVREAWFERRGSATTTHAIFLFSGSTRILLFDSDGDGGVAAVEVLVNLHSSLGAAGPSRTA